MQKAKYKFLLLTNTTITICNLRRKYMKATGIVRRIDDLGRVVIPKEIRRTMRIREGDPLEIYTDAGGEVIFKKYSPVGELSAFALEYADALSKSGGYPVIICDNDHVIAVSGMPKKEILERRISPTLEEMTQGRRSHVMKSLSDEKMYPVEGIDRHALVAMPIIVAGDVCGTIVLLSSDEHQSASETEEKLCAVAASFIAKQMEE